MLPDLPGREAEQQVIGLLMLNPVNVTRAVGLGLTPYDFYHQTYRNAFTAALALVQHGLETDWLSIEDECRRRGLALVKGSMLDCFGGLLPAASLDQTVWLVLDYARRRRALGALHEVEAQVEGGQVPSPEELLECLAAIVARGKSIPDLEQAMLSLYNDKVAADRHGGFVTPWPGMNRNIGGTIKPGETVAIAARTSVGKTWIVLQWILDALAKLPADCGALFITLEMRIAEVWHRVMALVNDINSTQVYNELLEPNGARHWDVMSKNPNAGRLRIVDPSNCKISDVNRLISDFRRDTGLKPQIVGIDYLGQMSFVDERASEYTRVSRNARALKDVAKEQDTTIMVACQLKRAERKNGRKGDGTTKPGLDDLRDSGAIEESMDRIIGAWAPKGEEFHDGQVNLTWLKNRHGKAIDDIEARFTAGNQLRELGYLSLVAGGD